MNIDVDLRVDLNTEDDTGLPWAFVRDARDPSLLREGVWLVVGLGKRTGRRPGRPDRWGAGLGASAAGTGQSVPRARRRPRRRLTFAPSDVNSVTAASYRP